MKTDVFIVDDSAAIRARLVELLGGVEGVRIVGQAETPVDAVMGILQTHPDHVVLDFQLLGGTGLEVLRKVHPQAPEIVFIVLTNHPGQHYRRICMDAGASFYFDKTTEFARVRDVIADSNIACNSH